ncbi:hypothetical protein HRW07_29625 [Streptomyces lunaelactis]|uniref:hypothetical protein n=1 Tax=Streptomyces lunaelactis TaxID=1535768 RepID=UPI001584E5B5|nr:hypothetical protein [Streptomyces lunaelactis]NUL07305.1 hypothetical protein [Streptomyces lunaelactis]
MDEMAAVRQLRADAPVPDRARLTPARQRLLDEIARPQRRRGGWKLAAVGAAAAVTAAALLSALPLRQENAASAMPTPRPHQWVHQKVRWDTWQCGTGASTYGFSEAGSFNLGPSSQPCVAKPAKPLYQNKWIRYDGGALATPDESSEDPDDVDVWNGRYQGGWEMLPPLSSDALMADLPDDPDAALTMIRRRSIPSRLVSTPRLTQAQRDFAEIVEVLSGSPVIAPEKARTIYRIITGLGGVTQPIEVTDGAGRAAIAIGIDGNFRDYSYERNGVQVLLDPETYAYQGVRYVAGIGYYVGGKASGGPFVARGTVIATATRVSTDIVDKAGRRR